jgi:hypothetical protein
VLLGSAAKLTIRLILKTSGFGAAWTEVAIKEALKAKIKSRGLSAIHGMFFIRPIPYFN